MKHVPKEMTRQTLRERPWPRGIPILHRMPQGVRTRAGRSHDIAVIEGWTLQRSQCWIVSIPVFRRCIRAGAADIENAVVHRTGHIGPGPLVMSASAFLVELVQRSQQPRRCPRKRKEHHRIVGLVGRPALRNAGQPVVLPALLGSAAARADEVRVLTTERVEQFAKIAGVGHIALHPPDEGRPPERPRRKKIKQVPVSRHEPEPFSSALFGVAERQQILPVEGQDGFTIDFKIAA